MKRFCLKTKIALYSKKTKHSVDTVVVEVGTTRVYVLLLFSCFSGCWESLSSEGSAIGNFLGTARLLEAPSDSTCDSVSGNDTRSVFAM